jgi:hypothetical protein
MGSVEIEQAGRYGAAVGKFGCRWLTLDMPAEDPEGEDV